LQQIHEDLESKGRPVEILAVSQDEDPGKVAPYLRENGLSPGFPVLLDPEKKASQVFGVDGYPSGYVLSADGKVVLAFSGYSEENLKWIFAYIEDFARSEATLRLFGDIGLYPWARLHIAKMNFRGVILGRDDGLFHSDDQVSRAECVTMAIRLMGLENQVARHAEDRTPFADNLLLPDWARGYLSLAVHKKILWLNPKGATFEPDRPATRAEICVMLVKALGLGREAERRKGEVLSFTDKAAVSPDQVGYVAVAVGRGIVRGYPDGTFRPGAPVTRAEMAVFCTRAERLAKDVPTEGWVVGTLEATSLYETPSDWWVWYQAERQITLRVDGSLSSHPVAADALIYLDEQEVSLADLPEFALLDVCFQEGVIVLVDAQSPHD
jgi:hypothetical protein